jgi:hypothetical protein
MLQHGHYIYVITPKGNLRLWCCTVAIYEARNKEHFHFHFLNNYFLLWYSLHVCAGSFLCSCHPQVCLLPSHPFTFSFPSLLSFIALCIFNKVAISNSRHQQMLSRNISSFTQVGCYFSIPARHFSSSRNARKQ